MELDPKAMPESWQRLPMSIRFPLLVNALGASILDAAIGELRQAGVREAGLQVIDSHSYIHFLSKPRFKAQVLGGSAVSVSGLRPLLEVCESVDDDSSYRNILGRALDIELYEDGSPWVLPADLDVDVGCRNGYGVFVSPERPPLAINETIRWATMDKLKQPKDENYDMKVIDRSVELHGSDIVHELSDTDCEQLLNVLYTARGFVDYMETVRTQSNWDPADQRFFPASGQGYDAVRRNVLALNRAAFARLRPAGP